MTLRIEVASEEATLKGSKLLVPWRLKEMEEEVAPIPATVPLSMRMPAAVEEAPVALTTKPLVKAPESLLLKLKKSEAESWPVLLMEEKGRLKTAELVEVEILKILPEVPVETFIITLLVTARVEVPDRAMPVPAVSREEMSEKLGAKEPLDLKTWKAVPPRVERKVLPS